jgi:hypothetical protein
MFNYVAERYESSALDLTYHFAPWDEPFLQGSRAAISAIRATTELEVADAFEIFRKRCAQSRVTLVSCRLPEDQPSECGFLEQQGSELPPHTRRPGRFKTNPDIDVRQADFEDLEETSAFAGQIFTSGRLHVDPPVCPEVGNRRLGRQRLLSSWTARAEMLHGSPQRGVHGRRATGPDEPISVPHRLGAWPLGATAWTARLAGDDRFPSRGATEVPTSIPSHHVAAHNLCVVGLPVPRAQHHAPPVSVRSAQRGRAMIHVFCLLIHRKASLAWRRLPQDSGLY